MILFAIVRVHDTIALQDSTYPLPSKVMRASSEKDEWPYFVPIYCITAHVPAISAPGRDPAKLGLAYNPPVQSGKT